MAEQTVELAPGESEVVTFEATPHEVREYQVSVDGLYGSFKAIAAVAEFAYVSDIKRGYYSYSYDYFTVDVQNVSNIAGTCTLEFYTRRMQRVPQGWTEWVLRATVSHTLQPGEVKTFGDNKECLMRAYFRNNVVRMSTKFVGEPGEIIWEHGAWA